MSRKIMVARLMVSNVFNFDIQDYALMNDDEVYRNYCIMLDVFDAEGRPIPLDWDIYI